MLLGAGRPAGAGADLRTGKAAGNGAGQRTDALFRAAAITIGVAGLAARKRHGKSANKKC